MFLGIALPSEPLTLHSWPWPRPMFLNARRQRRGATDSTNRCHVIRETGSAATPCLVRVEKGSTVIKKTASRGIAPRPGGLEGNFKCLCVCVCVCVCVKGYVYVCTRACLREYSHSFTCTCLGSFFAVVHAADTACICRAAAAVHFASYECDPGWCRRRARRKRAGQERERSA